MMGIKQALIYLLKRELSRVTDELREAHAYLGECRNFFAGSIEEEKKTIERIRKLELEERQLETHIHNVRLDKG